MHANTTYTIYWSPQGACRRLPDAHQPVLPDVAADSGTTSNVYATDTQYYRLERPDRLQLARSAARTSTPERSRTTARAVPGTGATSQRLRARLRPPGRGRPRRHDATAGPAANPAVLRLHAEERRLVLRRTSGGYCAYNYYCAYHSDFYDGQAGRRPLREPAVHRHLGRRRGQASATRARTRTATGPTRPSTSRATSTTRRSPTRTGNAWYDSPGLRERRQVRLELRHRRSAATAVRPVQPGDQRPPLLPPAGVEQRVERVACSQTGTAPPPLSADDHERDADLRARRRERDDHGHEPHRRDLGQVQRHERDLHGQRRRQLDRDDRAFGRRRTGRSPSPPRPVRRAPAPSRSSRAPDFSIDVRRRARRSGAARRPSTRSRSHA